MIGVIYRPPNLSTDKFNSCFSNLINNLASLDCPIYLTGDYNINLVNYPYGNAASNFIHSMAPHGFFPLVNIPTSVTKRSAAIIDNIMTNDSNSL